MNVFELEASINLDKSGFEAGINEVKASGESAGNSISKGFGGKLANVAVVAKTAATAAIAVGTAVVSAGKAFYGAAADVAEYGDAIDKASQRLGVSSQFYQEMEAVMGHSGTSMSAMTGAFKTLSNAAQDASADQAAAFERIGMSLDQVKTMSQEDLFTNVIKGLGQMEEGTERTALAQDLLGRSAMELGPLLNSIGSDPEALDNMIARFDELGLLTEEDVAASARFQDSLQDLTTGFEGVSRSMLADFLPGMADIMDGITNVFAGESGADAISQGIQSMLQAAQDDIPLLMEVGGEIISGLAEGIVAALPVLLEGAGELWESLYDAAVEFAPNLEEAGYKFIEYLANGMPGAFSIVCGILNNLGATIFTVLGAFISGMLQKGAEMVSNLGAGISASVSAAVSAITGVGQSIINSIQIFVSQMIEKGRTMISNLASGVSGAIGVITGAITTIINGIKSPLQNLDLSSIGANIIQGLYNGIKSKFDAVIGSITGFANSIGNAFKTATQQASPSKLWKRYGQYLIDGLIIGIESRTENAVDAVQRLATAINAKASAAVTAIQEQIEAIQAEQQRRADEKELADRQKKIAELEKKIAEAKAADVAKYQEELADLRAEYAEADLKKQEEAEIKSLKATESHLSDLQKAYQKSMDDIADTYDDSISEITKSQDRMQSKLMDYGDLFTWNTTKRSGKYMSLGNLDTDINNLTKYSEILNTLADMGVPASLMAEILDMSIDDAIAYGNKLLNMGSSTFTSYLEKWNTREALANSISSGWYAGDKQAAQIARSAAEAKVETEYADQIGLSIASTIGAQFNEFLRSMSANKSVIIQIDGKTIGSALLNPLGSAMRQRGVVSLV